MKILFVGVFVEGSTNLGQVGGFSRLGHEVVRYDYRDRLQKNRNNVVARDRDLCAVIRQLRPDLTVFSKCNNMSWEPVEVANEGKGQSCLWFMDPKNANFNAELHEKINRASFSCFGQVPLDEVRKACPNAAGRIFFVSEGYDEEVDFPFEGADPIHDVSFIGSVVDPRRGSLHRQLGFHVYWGAFGRNHARAVAETKINLNLTYPEGGTSDRVHKIMAAGGFVLTQPWHGMEEMFEAGKHLAVFETVDDYCQEVEYYLEHEDERLQIAQAGHVKNKPYSRTGWARFIIDTAERGRRT